MADREEQLLQQTQDLLSDLCGIPMALFKYAPFRESLAEIRSPTKWQSLYNDARVTRWSLNHALFRFLEGHPFLWHEFLRPFKSALHTIEDNAGRDVWEPVVFRGLFKCWSFILPITELQIGKDPKKQKRKICYLLCGGPVARAATSDWESLWQDMEELETNDVSFAKTLQYQLIPELLEVPPWKVGESFSNEESSRKEELVFELNTLRMTLNGVVRDLLNPIRLQGYDLMAAIYELFQLVGQREHLKRGLTGLSELLPRAVAVAIVLRNSVTRSGFLAIHVPSGKGESEFQLLFIPLPKDTNDYFNSTRFDQTPETDRKFLDLPVSNQYSARLNLPKDALNPFSAVWLFGESERAVDRLVKRARSSSVEAFLNGWLPIFDVSEARINRRVSQAQQQAAHHARHEIADLVTNSEFLPQEVIQQFLHGVQTLPEVERVGYFRPRLHEPNPDGGVSAEWFAGSPEGTDEKEPPIVITKPMVERLFNRRIPYVLTEQSSAIIPVISANRTLGLLRFGFRGDKELKNTMPIMIELGCRLGIRVPYQRLLELTKKIMEQMARTARVDWQALAGDIAFLFGESACSIWKHNKNERKFARLAMVGSDLSLREISDDEAKQSLIGVCLDRHSPVLVNLEKPSSDVQVLMKDELLQGGFKHGIAVGTTSRDAPLSLIVTLWSKTHFLTDHFSSDDLNTLSFLALIMLQMLSVHHLVRAQKEAHDAVLTGLGHELGAPLAAFYDALSLFPPSRRLQDMKSLVEYTQELIGGLFIFARIEGLSFLPDARDAGQTIEVQLFEDLIFPIERVMLFMIRGRRLGLEHHFDPSEFPPALRIPKGEDRYLRNIIFNLLSNAVKYSPPATPQPIRIIGEMTASGVEIRVQNFGIGVPKGEEDLIFEREWRGSNAFQTAIVGSGMGLYISRKLAKLLGGDVLLSRRAGPTEFVVQLPLELAFFQSWRGDSAS